jgi:hypothetical protein
MLDCDVGLARPQPECAADEPGRLRNPQFYSSPAGERRSRACPWLEQGQALRRPGVSWLEPFASRYCTAPHRGNSPPDRSSNTRSVRSRVGYSRNSRSPDNSPTTDLQTLLRRKTGYREIDPREIPLREIPLREIRRREIRQRS